MPQRKSFAPMPMGNPNTPPAPHGMPGRPPNLVPGPQPLPPASPVGGGTGPTPNPMMGNPPRPPLPSSIPLSPMQPTPQQGPPPPAAPPMMGAGAGTVDPLDVQPFLKTQTQGTSLGPMVNSGMGPMSGGAGGPVGPTGRAMEDPADRLRLPHESRTTAADLHDTGYDDDGDENGAGGLPHALLSMISTLTKK